MREAHAEKGKSYVSRDLEGMFHLPYNESQRDSPLSRRGALGGISSCYLVSTGDHLHPSLATLLLTQQILLETSLCQVLLSELGMLQRMCFQMSESRTGPWRAMQSSWVMMALFSWSFSSLSPFLPPNCDQPPYLRFQSRLLNPWEFTGSRGAFSG